MKQNIDKHVIANWARMRGNRHRGPCIVIVEGEKDVRLYSGFLSEKVRIIPGHGKPNLIGALMILEGEGWKGVIGIADADFDLVAGQVSELANLFLTDTHDLETMILRSPALRKVLREMRIEPDRFLEASFPKVVEAGRLIGCLRWVSTTHHLELVFSQMKPEDFTDPRTLSLKEDRLVDSVLRATRNPLREKTSIQKYFRETISQFLDEWQMSCGHDLVALISFALEHAHNTRVHPETLEKDLRLAYEYDHFRRTEMYSSMKSWEQLNPAFRVLRQVAAG